MHNDNLSALPRELDTPPSRQAAIATAKAHGREVLAVLPIFYPKPLLTAMDILAVELWGPPGEPRGSQVGRLQAYVCPLARNALAFIASGGAQTASAFLYPHTCDSIQGLATQIPDFGGADQPALRFRLPKGGSRPSARAYLRGELLHLAADLEAITGHALDPVRLTWALDLHDRVDAARATLLAQRSRLPLGDRALYTLLRRGEFLWPEDHLSELQAALTTLADTPVQRGIPLLVSGIVPEPMAILDHLATIGAYIAADDYAAVGRRIPLDARPAPDAPPDTGASSPHVAPLPPPPPTTPSPHTSSPGKDPITRLMERFFATPPCPTRAPRLDARLAHLLHRARASACAGVILHTVQFCEPELSDVAELRRHLSAHGLPLLVLESDLSNELAERTATRLEAFAEMLMAREAPVPAHPTPAYPAPQDTGQRPSPSSTGDNA